MIQPEARTAPRPVYVRHCTSEPFRFFGREEELELLERGFGGAGPSVVALVGPGGQGKTAIVQHWLEPFRTGQRTADGVFLWSFYRGKDADLCLRELYAYAENAAPPASAPVSATWCVDRLVPLLRRERWVLVLDGAEVAQHDGGPWFGRFLHPELSRLLEELASEPMPGLVLVTSRFPLPELERRRHARVIGLGGLDAASARGLLRSLGVEGTDAELDAASSSCAGHAKAVELLGTYLVHVHHGAASRYRDLPEVPAAEGASALEQHVARVLAAHQSALAQPAQDILALATAFRDPPTESRLLDYLTSAPVQTLLKDTWQRTYPLFADRSRAWLAGQIETLIQLRLLERVGHRSPAAALPHGEARSVRPGTEAVIDAHPLVRRGFEHVLGAAGQRQSALARAGFLRGRPDRRRPATLDEAREEIELFHAYCDAGLWNEADSAYLALDNPKHRWLAPALERDLLLRFFPGRDWRQKPLWSGFGRFRSLAIAFELLGDFEEALSAYERTGADAALCGDALIALGRLQPLLDRPQAPHPWQTLWQAYRAHALCLAGRQHEAVALARSLVPVDVYEWVHVFECLLRAGRLEAVDLGSVLFRPPQQGSEHRWAELARQRMRLDYLRLTGGSAAGDLRPEFDRLLDAYDQAGLPFERALTRLSLGRWLLAQGQRDEARPVQAVALDLAQRHGMAIIQADACSLASAWDPAADRQVEQLRTALGYRGPLRP